MIIRVKLETQKNPRRIEEGKKELCTKRTIWWFTGISRKLQQWCNYVSGLDSIVWVVGGVTTVRFNSWEPDPPALSRISLYSWQIAQKWQKKWVTKSPQGASCITFQKLKHCRPWKNSNRELTHRLSLKRDWIIESRATLYGRDQFTALSRDKPKK